MKKMKVVEQLETCKFVSVNFWGTIHPKKLWHFQKLKGPKLEAFTVFELRLFDKSFHKSNISVILFGASVQDLVNCPRRGD
jgi:hypothetical protein